MMEEYIGAFVAEAMRHGWDVTVSYTGVLFFRCWNRIGDESVMHVATEEEIRQLRNPDLAAKADLARVFQMFEEKKCAQ